MARKMKITLITPNQRKNNALSSIADINDQDKIDFDFGYASSLKLI